jgi:hypothetical protein
MHCKIHFLLISLINKVDVLLYTESLGCFEWVSMATFSLCTQNNREIQLQLYTLEQRIQNVLNCKIYIMELMLIPLQCNFVMY